MNQNIRQGVNLDAPMSLASHVVAVSGLVSCDLAGETVILSLDTGKYYGLDSVGVRIWALLQEPTSIDAIRTALLEEYDVEPEVCTRDLLALLHNLAANKLITIKELVNA